MTNYNGDLIVAGEFDSIGGISAHNIAKWNGTQWSALSSGFKIKASYSNTLSVNSILVYNGDLYAGGQFDTAGGMPANNIAKWDGTSWSALGLGLPGYNYIVLTLAVYNGALYAGGRFDTAGGLRANNIAKWNGTQWSTVDSGILITEGVNCLTVHNGSLYAGGEFYKAGSIAAKNIAVWNDTTWSALANPLPAFALQVSSTVSYQGELYAAFFNYANDSLGIWNGTKWTTIAGVHSTFFNIGIDVLLVFDGKLIVGGGFDSIGGIAANNLAQWDGSNWSEFGAGVNGPSTPQVDALCSYNTHLFAGGDFNMAGSVSANSIAEYTCETTGIPAISLSQVSLYPNPAKDRINITCENIPKYSVIEVFDLQGRSMHKFDISKDKTEIELQGFTPGIYLYRISAKNGESLYTGRFAVE